MPPPAPSTPNPVMTIPIPRLTLYYAHKACSLAPRALLTHLSIPFTAVRMVISPNSTGCHSFDGTLTAADYRRLNPSGFVPALAIQPLHSDEVQVITEVSAILTYIAHLAHQPELLGETRLERARITEWLALLSYIHSHSWSMVRRPGRFSDEESAWEKIKQKGMEGTILNYEEIERRLQKGYLEREKVTVVHFYLYVFWLWGKEVGLELWRGHGEFGAVMRTVEGLEGVKRVARDEGWELGTREP